MDRENVQEALSILRIESARVDSDLISKFKIDPEQFKTRDAALRAATVHMDDSCFLEIEDRESDIFSDDLVSHISSSGYSIARLAPRVILRLSRAVEKDEHLFLPGCQLLTPTEADLLGSAMAARLKRAGLLTAAPTIHAWVKVPWSRGCFRYGTLADEYPVRLTQVLERDFRARNYEPAHAYMCQLILNLANMQSLSGIVHNDLDARNVLCRSSSSRSNVFCWETRERVVYEIPTFGTDLAVIDFTSAYICPPGQDPRASGVSEIGDSLLVRSRNHVGWRDTMTLAASIMETLLRTADQSTRELVRSVWERRGSSSSSSSSSKYGGALERLVHLLFDCCDVRDLRTARTLNLFDMPAPSGGFSGFALLNMMCSPISSRGLYAITCSQLVREWVCRLSGPDYEEIHSSSLVGLVESKAFESYRRAEAAREYVPIHPPVAYTFPPVDIRKIDEETLAWSSLGKEELCHQAKPRD